MTIAAGLLHKYGVLLCADTQQEDWAKRIHKRKIGFFTGSWGSLVYAAAGDMALAYSAMEKCQRKLEHATPETAYDMIERVLDKEYRRNVLSHPDHKTDQLQYWLLIGFWTPLSGGVKFYATKDTAIEQIDWFRCVGVGDMLADPLIRPVFWTGMSEYEALCLASYAMAITKERVPQCGGMSLFISLGSDGSIKQFYDHPYVNHVEDIALEYEYSVQRLLLQHMQRFGTDEDFEKNLELFNRDVRKLRNKWKLIKPDEFRDPKD
jgi:hypothetical protein